MFDNIIEQVGAALTPHASKLGNQIAGTAETVIDLLLDIRDNTDSPQFQERRNRVYLNLNAANGRTQTVDVPAAESWDLDVASYVGAAGTLVIRQGGLLVYADAPAAAQTKSAIGVAVESGTQIAVTASVDAEVVLVFLCRVPKAARKARGRGDQNLFDPEGTEGGVEPERHLSPGLNLVAGGGGLADVGTNNH